MTLLASLVSGMVAGSMRAPCPRHSSPIASASALFGTTNGALPGVRTGWPSSSKRLPTSLILDGDIAVKALEITSAYPSAPQGLGDVFSCSVIVRSCPSRLPDLPGCFGTGLGTSWRAGAGFRPNPAPARQLVRGGSKQPGKSGGGKDKT